MKQTSLKYFTQLLNLPANNFKDILVTGVAIDSRQIKKNDLFFALPGAKVDGHDFIEEVAAKGASAAIVRDSFRNENCKLPLIHVPDVLETLQTMAKISLTKRKSKVIAITGSIGKTTTKSFLNTLLKDSYNVFASPLNYNTKITLPLNILMADGDEDFLILEMGMSNKGDLDKLISIAPPDIAILTNVSIQHAINFSDGLAGISQEKAAIFSSTKTEIGFLPKDLFHFEEINNIGCCKKRTFSINEKQADYHIIRKENKIEVFENQQSVCEIDNVLPVWEHYNNLLVAMATARYLNICWRDIKMAAQNVTLPPMRFEKIKKNNVLFVNDAYNANPDSMKAALESLPQPENKGKTIAVLSEMDALGMYTEAGHAMVAEVALQHADVLLCIGSRCETMRKIWKEKKKSVELFQSREELVEALQNEIEPGDVVLLKGARSYALNEILNDFD